jgi:tetratricopeptide (TPR) repeat protein|tara:strand:+ start:302 stop:1978 length:1677 start_codon:yes stop_codon:yes gene_type:complete
VNLTLDEALKKGVEAHAAGQIQEANRFYLSILKAQPKHPDANHNMGALCMDVGKVQEALPFFKAAVTATPSAVKFWLDYIDALIKLDRTFDANAAFKQAKNNGAKGEAFDQFETIFSGRGISEVNPQDPPSNEFQPIINLFTQRRLEQALSATSQMLERFPKSSALYNIAGASNAGLMQFDAALVSYKHVLRIQPNNAEVYYNIGSVLQSLGDPEAAIDSYKKALKIKPDYADAYNNIGVLLNDKDDPEAAIESYKQALMIQPDNVGAKSNLLALLTSYTPQKAYPNLIMTVNEAIQKIDMKDNASNIIISDRQAADLFDKASGNISSYGLELSTGLSQAYRKSSIDLNCKRHMSIFKKHGVIPEFCFGCYKVQVNPRSIIELIKLYFVFDQLELNKNNSRKCMVELRPNIAGFYKGYIFCSGLKQANQISAHVNEVLEKRIGSGLSSTVKRGCSEYPISFPDYKEINNSGAQLMNYNKDWKVIEEDYDKKTPMHAKKNKRPSIAGLNLNDTLIIRNWIDYAKGIGDPSADLINQTPIINKRIYERAKARLDRFIFSS